MAAGEEWFSLTDLVGVIREMLNLLFRAIARATRLEAPAPQARSSILKRDREKKRDSRSLRSKTSHPAKVPS